MKTFVLLLFLGLSTVSASGTNDSPVIQQERVTVNGTVTDNFGESLIGVSISVKGTNQGITTDLDGKYTIQVTPGQTLVFSYIGYVTQEVTVKNQQTIDIKLIEDTQNIDEIVVNRLWYDEKK